jgi:Xaa-Pro aminopeptidase
VSADDLPGLTGLPPLDIAGRAARLRSGFESAGVDALLVNRLVNIRYLTGFTGSAGLLLVLPDGLVLVTDGRYRFQSAEQLAVAGVHAAIEIGDVAEQRAVLAARVARAAGLRRLGLEAHGVTWAQQRSYAAEWFPHVELIATEGLVEELRRVKDAGEVARIRAACGIADDALAEVRGRLAEGIAERDFALELEWAMRGRGASGVSFETIVASGPNGAKPHARPTGRQVGTGELVVVDFGCVVDGYCSDMTRTLAIGDVGRDARRMYDVVLESQAAGRAAVREGVVASDVDRACRDVIAAAGWADAFMHSTGHGVGLEIHEAPWVRATSSDTLKAGHVVTVEPGVYLPDIGGVRIEDTVVVTPDGYDTLTQTPRHADL